MINLILAVSLIIPSGCVEYGFADMNKYMVVNSASVSQISHGGFQTLVMSNEVLDRRLVYAKIGCPTILHLLGFC